MNLGGFKLEKKVDLELKTPLFAYRTLEPNFVPERPYEHRKSHPIYHEKGSAKPKNPRVRT